MPVRLLSIRAYYFLIFTSLGIFIPYFPQWLDAHDLRGAAMGAAMALNPAMGLLAPPVFGFMADSFGLRGRLLAIACGGAGLALGALALVSSPGNPLGMAGIFAALLCYAFFRAPIIPLIDVIAIEEVRTGSVTYPSLRLWGSLGFLTTAFFAGSALDPSAPAQIPLAIAGALLLAMVASFSLPARVKVAPSLSPQIRAEPVRKLLGSADFRLFLAASLLSQAAHSSYDLCFSLHLRDLGIGGPLVGSAWAIGVVAEIALMAFGSRFLERSSPPRLFAIALAGASLRWLFIAAVHDRTALLVAQPLHAISFGLMWLSSVAYIRHRVDPGILATAQGLFMASTSAGSVFGMLAWGAIYRAAGGATTFGVAALVSACAAALAVALARRPP